MVALTRVVRNPPGTNIFYIVMSYEARWDEKRTEPEGSLFSVYRAIFVPTFILHGHEVWIMIERTRLQIQAAEMSFLRRVAGTSLRDRVRSSVIRGGLGVEPLLLH